MSSDRAALFAAADGLAAEFATRAAEHDRDASFPFENFARLHAAGLLNLPMPARYGGPGLGLADCAGVIGRLAAGEPSTALVLTMHFLQLRSILHGEAWPERVREMMARESLAGVALANALAVEPELGTPSRGGVPATTARRVAEGWQLSGRKIYSTGSPVLRWGVVAAKTDDAEPLIGNFLLPMATPGVRVVETWDHMGMRASGSHDVVMEEVLIPADHVAQLRPPGAPAKEPAIAAWGTMMVASLYSGVARAARDWVMGFARSRVPANLGKPLATLPRFQEAVGEMDGLLLANRHGIGAVARAIDDGTEVPLHEINLVKYTASRNAIAAVDRALELAGNPGLTRANPLERHHRDVLCSRIHWPQDDAALRAAGQAAFGPI